MSRTLRFTSAVLCAVAGLACARWTRQPVDPPEVLLHLPGESIGAFALAPDGALFVESNRGVYARSKSGSSWTRLPLPNAPFPVRALYAASSDELFAVSGFCTEVFRWSSQSGWTRMQTPFTDSTWVDAGGEQCHLAHDIWGSSGKRVFVGTDHAGLLYFDGSTWTAQSLPPRIAASSERINYGIRAITGDSTKAFALTHDALFIQHDSAWTVGSWELGMLPDDCRILTAVALVSDAVVIGGLQPCLLLYGESGPVSLTRHLRGMTSPILGGRSQPNGAAVFWNRKGRIVVVHRDFRVTSYVLGSISPFRGAGIFGDYLYGAGGSMETSSVVVRIPLAGKAR